MRIRSKFTVMQVATFGNCGKELTITAPDPANVPGGAQKYLDTGVPVREISMSAICGGKDLEDVSFAQNTPSGTIRFQLNNPALADSFKPGQTYYVDFTPAE